MKKVSTRPFRVQAGMQAPLKDLGNAVVALFPAEEPEVGRDARCLFRRLVPDVTTSPQLLDGVPQFVESLLDSLDRLEPKYSSERRAIAAAWVEVEGSAAT
jgi:hypothetical protein